MLCGSRGCATPAEIPAISKCSPPTLTSTLPSCFLPRRNSRKQLRSSSFMPHSAEVGNDSQNKCATQRIEMHQNTEDPIPCELTLSPAQSFPTTNSPTTQQSAASSPIC